MPKSARKTVLIISVIGFVAMSTGFLMFIHLLEIKHHEHHDHSECMICQKSLLSPKKAIIEPETTIKNIKLLSHNVQWYISEEKNTTKYLLPLLRAPPYVC